MSADEGLTQEEVRDIYEPTDGELETDEAILAAQLISRHIPSITSPDDNIDRAEVMCSCGKLTYHTDNDEYALTEWSVHLGIELDQEELLQRQAVQS